MKKRIILVLMVIGFSGLFTFLLVYPWSSPSPSSKWMYYIESGIYTASEEVYIENVTFTLETYMWRDFMPISPPDGKPLIVIAKVHAVDVVEFPLTISIERIWIINGTEISSTLGTNEYRINGSTYEMVFRDGPKWGPGIVIDVVVKLKSVDFNFYYLLALNQPIYRTD
ncbi:MAG: hypothetical protein ACFFB6_09120 [Promethearchaeota archaeon]